MYINFTFYNQFPTEIIVEIDNFTIQPTLMIKC